MYPTFTNPQVSNWRLKICSLLFMVRWLLVLCANVSTVLPLKFTGMTFGTMSPSQRDRSILKQSSNNKRKKKQKHKAQNKWELLRNVPQIQVRCKNCVRATEVRRNMRGLNMQVCTHNVPALKQIHTYCLILSIKKGSYFKKNIYMVIKLYNHIRKTWCTEQQCLVLSIWLWRRKTTWTLSSTLTKFM